MVGMALIGIAAIRAHGEFQGDDVLVWGWRVGLAVALVLLATLRIVMSRPVVPQPVGARADLA